LSRKRAAGAAALLAAVVASLACGAQEEEAPPQSPLRPIGKEWRLDGDLVALKPPTTTGGAVEVTLAVHAARSEDYKTMRILTPPKRKVAQVPPDAVLHFEGTTTSIAQATAETFSALRKAVGQGVSLTGLDVDRGQVRLMGVGSVGFRWPKSATGPKQKPVPVPALLGKPLATVSRVLGKGRVVNKLPGELWYSFKKSGFPEVQAVIVVGRCEALVVRRLRVAANWADVARQLGLKSADGQVALVGVKTLEPMVPAAFAVRNHPQLRSATPKHIIDFRAGGEVWIGVDEAAIGVEGLR
jgi:hypothetical protein